jgi:biotin-dependent carboxylase-like uncharacterized protein
MGSLIVLQPGMLSIVQDLGRYGYQSMGITPSGAMDRYSLIIANLLVGNKGNVSVIEFTGMGPTLRFSESALFALTGGDFSATLNGISVDRYESVEANPGDLLSLKGAKDGFRGYLAIAGGFEILPVLGSCSTDISSNFGGKRLVKNDVLKFKDSGDRVFRRASELIRKSIDENIYTIRVIMGPDDRRFTESGLETFLNADYRITEDSNRMGYRLEGQQIEHTDTADITSSSVTFGTIQVPGSGQPIVMMAEHQTTGGYTRIAHVISRDLAVMAQLKPGDQIHFEKVGLKEAVQLDNEYQKQIVDLTSRVFRRFQISVNGQSYKVDVEACDE